MFFLLVKIVSVIYQPGTIPAGCERAAKVIKHFNFTGTCPYNLQIISKLEKVQVYQFSHPAIVCNKDNTVFLPSVAAFHIFFMNDFLHRFIIHLAFYP